MIRYTENKIQKNETENAKVIRTIAPESTVLLKKDGSFPLREIGHIAVYGNGARHTIKGGTGSGDVNVHHFVTIEEGLENAGFHIVTKDWLKQYDVVMHEAKKAFFTELKVQAKQIGIPVTMLAIGKVVPEPEYTIPINAECETAIYCLARNSGEGGDRKNEKGDIKLNDSEIRDILEINEKYKRFMLVLNVGGLVDLTPVKNVKNILVLGQLGTPTGDVLADILTGKSYPSGKLTMTWANLEKYPSTYGFGDLNDTCYNEGIYVGYRYFEKIGEEVGYRFGYGLGFTDFEIGKSKVSVKKDEISINTEVRNIGRYKGKEVVQVYCSKPDGKLNQPVKELIGFAKTKELFPGEEDTVEITFRVDAMESFCEDCEAYILADGNYYLSVGTDSGNTRIIACIKNEEQLTVLQTKNLFANLEVESRLKGSIFEGKNTVSREESTEVETFILNKEIIKTKKAIYEEKKWLAEKQATADWRDVVSGRISIEKFAEGLTDRELAYVCCGSKVNLTDIGNVIGSASSKVAGAAGETTGMLADSHHLESIVLCDGPAGIRIAPVYTLKNGRTESKEMSFGKEMMEFLDEEDLEQLKRQANLNMSEDEEKLYFQYCTAIPIATDIAQSFNLEAAKCYGQIVGEEMQMFGIQLWLAPALNIQRSPLCGRNFEYYSEDPYVSGMMAAAITESVQKFKGCGVTLKHFACNNQETNRYGSNSIVSERALREIYLKGFEIAVKKAKPRAIMSSYNLLNGEHTANKKELLKNILRDEWKFDGMVMTDWFTSTNIMNIPDGKYTNSSAAGCVKAGNNLIMPGMATDLEDIMNALNNTQHTYTITRDDLINCALPVLKCIYEIGKEVEEL